MAYATLSAISHEGFGGRERYEQLYALGNEDRNQKIEDIKRKFSLRYGVPLDDISVNISVAELDNGEYQIKR